MPANVAFPMTRCGGPAQLSQTEFGFYGVSEFLTLDLDVAELCASTDYLHRYSQIQESTAGWIRSAGFAMLATDARPHFDIVSGRPRGRHARAAQGMLRAAPAQPGPVVECRW